MNGYNINARTFVVAFCCVAMCLVPSRDCAAESQADSLAGKWLSFEEEVLTGHITYLSFAHANKFTNLTADRLERAFVTDLMAGSPQSISAFAIVVAGGRAAVDRPQWPTLDFFFDGKNNRSEAYGNETVTNGTRRVDRRPPIEGAGRADIAISLNATSSYESYIPRLSDFRFVPTTAFASSLHLIDETIDLQIYATVEDTRVKENKGPFSLLYVDAVTGEVHKYLSFDPSGKLASIVLQDDFQDFGSGIRFPVKHCAARVNEGVVSMLIATVIVAADFNHELPANINLTDVAVLPGDLIRDNTGATPLFVTAERKGYATQLIDDQTRLTTSAPTTTSPSGRTALWILSILGAVLVGAIIFLMIRKSRASR